MALTWIVLFKLQIPFDGLWITPVRIINLIPFPGALTGHGGFQLTEVVENVLAFVPFGIYLSLLKTDWTCLKKLLPMIGFSLIVEIMQFVFAMGRTDITDLINNTLGGLIGIGIYAVLSKILRDRTNGIIRIIALLLTISVLLFVTILLVTNRFPRFI
jgi:glycopeptide antibiotics resistance protein